MNATLTHTDRATGTERLVETFDLALTLGTGLLLRDVRRALALPESFDLTLWQTEHLTKLSITTSTAIVVLTFSDQRISFLQVRDVLPRMAAACAGARVAAPTPLHPRMARLRLTADDRPDPLVDVEVHYLAGGAGPAASEHQVQAAVQAALGDELVAVQFRGRSAGGFFVIVDAPERLTPLQLGPSTYHTHTRAPLHATIEISENAPFTLDGLRPALMALTDALQVALRSGAPPALATR